MRSRSAREHERGQVLVFFVILSVLVIGLVAVVIDVAWFWSNQQQMQKAADAGALAGAVYLPGDTNRAYSAARAEATKNGYTSGQAGVSVVPVQDPGNRRRLQVTISGPVNSFFARVFCVVTSCTEQVTVRVTALAEFVLPVPMGSPQNYFGIGFMVDASETSAAASSTRSASSSVSGGGWTNPGNVYTNNDSYSTASISGSAQQWAGFGLDGTVPATATIDAVQVLLSDLFLSGSGTASSCRVSMDLSWNNGSTWSSVQQTGTLNASTSADYVIGSAADTSGWGSHAWTPADFTSFRVRLTWIDGVLGCSASRSVSLDQLQVTVHYSSSSVSTGPVTVDGPDGAALAPQNFWAAMNSQGAPNIQGDAYMTEYETRGGASNRNDGTDPDGRYAPDEYYNYAVEIPAGALGEVWIFDPGFCDSASAGLGTGEFWTVGPPNGNNERWPVSSYFDLYDTNETPYDLDDDVLRASSNALFEQLDFEDHGLGRAVGRQPTEPDCGAETWHHNWWRLASGLAGGRTYRLHTYSTDPSRPGDQRNTTAHNAFGFWAGSSSGTPRIYGIGAMEAYVRLPGGRASEFYLAQIEAAHAGKTMQIDLWDPGDTGALSASLEILKPTSTGYVPATFSYTARRESSGGSSCDSRSGTSVGSVTTNTGGTSLFNGCWLTVTLALPADYDAPHPSTDTVTSEGGWWKIRYSMGGSSSSYSTDLTTWQVAIRGSPVHLIPAP
jgi:Flp pilus assembly protein TadG